MDADLARFEADLRERAQNGRKIPGEGRTNEEGISKKGRKVGPADWKKLKGASDLNIYLDMIRSREKWSKCTPSLSLGRPKAQGSRGGGRGEE